MKKTVTTIVAFLVSVGVLAWVVSAVDVVAFLKRMHGG